MLKIPPTTEHKPPRLVPALAAAVLAALVAAAFSFEGCATMAIRPDPAHYRKPVVVKMTVTGYCNCRKCCGWRYTWYGKPVYDKSGKTKKVGMTSSGVRARTGTIAADIKKYPATDYNWSSNPNEYPEALHTFMNEHSSLAGTAGNVTLTVTLLFGMVK